MWIPAGIRVDSGQMRLRPHRQEAGSGAGGEGPQEARGSAEPAVGREGRAHGRQEARGNGEGKAHRKVYAAGKSRRQADVVAAAKPCTPGQIFQGTGLHDMMLPDIKSSTAQNGGPLVVYPVSVVLNPWLSVLGSQS